MDQHDNYYTGSVWSPDRAARKLYAHRWLAVLIRRAVGGHIYCDG